MANSKLLKEAIADAKAVRETAIANAKIALEEAFTPRLQSILSKKLQAEMEDMDDEEEVAEDLGSSDIGGGDNDEPAAVADDSSTDLSVSGTDQETAAVGEEDENADVVSEEDMEMSDDEEMAEEEMGEEPEEDELDLEAIIRELESELEEEDENQDGVLDDPTGATMEEEDEMDSEEPAMEGEEMEMDFDSEEEVSEEEDETIDLDEILREMGYGDDEEEVSEEEEGEDEMQVVQSELKNAYSTIQELRKTINEVNLLNAKLLYANKLFRGYNLTNEQKVKIVENLDRTSSVREVKLVYATLAESMKFTGTERKVAATKKTMTEGLASRTTASTAPKKEIIAESNDLANRFRELAGIVKK
jgi:hypothetical protein